MIKVCANGKFFELESTAVVTDVLCALGIEKAKFIAVEQNGSIVPCDQFKSTPVADGDVLEVITPMGGG